MDSSRVFNNWVVITLSHKATISEDFEDIHLVAFDVISDNIASFVQSGMYGDMNTIYSTTMGYYVIKFVSDA